MRFSARYDRTTKIVSTAIAVLLIALVAVLQNWLVGGLLPALLFLAYAYSPRGYVITGDSILVRRLVGDVRIALPAIREARRAAAGDFQGCVRLMGSGGLFGYYGWFRTAPLGKSRWFVTDRRAAVIVRGADQVIVLSPDDPDRFLQALHLPAAPDPLINHAAGTPVSSGWAPKLLAAAVIGSGAALIPLLLLYAPGPDRYTLTRQTLTIHDRFYPVTLRAEAVNVSGIRIVDLATDPRWRPTMRANGFSNSHYQSGWYRVAGGQKVRLYRAAGEKLVLLPPKGSGSPVLYQPPDPARFLAEVRRVWAGSQDSL